jgi:transcriptional regulator with XRE-family HTH domain
MTLTELIQAAGIAAGNEKTLAAEMGKHQNRFAEWKRGERKPDASEIAYMAARAGLPVLETVAEIQANTPGEYAGIWRDALGRLRAAGVAAAVVAGALSHEKQAEALTLHSVKEVVCILCKLAWSTLKRGGLLLQEQRQPITAEC